MALPDLTVMSDEELLELINSYHRQLNYEPGPDDDESLYDDIIQCITEAHRRKLKMESTWKIVGKEE